MPPGNAPPPGRGNRRRREPPLTKAGRTLATVVVVAYVAGVALGYTPLLVVAAGGAVALVAAAAFVLWRPRVVLSRSFHPSTVVAGEPAVAVLEVRNTARTPCPPLTVRDHLGASDVTVRLPPARAGRAVLARYELPTSRRGRLVLGPLRVVRADPLGLVSIGQDHGGVDLLWVHPRTWPLASVPAGVVVDLEGPVSETSPPGSVTFSSLREYVPGDDRRLIHWRSSARLGTLLVRHHVDTREPRATIVVDARPHMWSEESFESGIEIAASVAAALEGNGHLVRLRVVGEAPGRARRLGAITIADHLAAAELAASPDPGTLLSAIENEPEGGALVVVSGTLEPAVQSRVGAQHRRFSPVVVCRVEPGSRPGRRRRPAMSVVRGPTSAAVAEAWNRMARR